MRRPNKIILVHTYVLHPISLSPISFTWRTRKSYICPNNTPSLSLLLDEDTWKRIHEINHAAITESAIGEN